MSHPMQAHPPTGHFNPQYTPHAVASTSTSQAITNNKPKAPKEKEVQIPLPQEKVEDAELSLLRHPNLKGDLNQALLRTADQVAPGVKLDPDAEELLLYMTGDFLSNLVNFSCRIASHKGGGQVAPEDVALYLERVINMPIQLDRPPPAPRPPPAQKRKVREEEEEDEDEEEEEEDEDEEPESNIGERLRARHGRSASTASKPSAPPPRNRPRRGTITKSAPVVEEPSGEDDEEDEEGDEEGEENDEEQQEGDEEGEGDEEEESEEEEAQPRESQRLKEKAKAAKTRRGRGRGRGSRGRR